MSQPSIRLTQPLRDGIARRMIAHRFADDVAASAAGFAALAGDVYNAVYSRKQRELIASLPKGWLPLEIHIAVTLGGDVRYLAFNGHGYGCAPSLVPAPDAVTRPVADKHRRGVAATYPATHRFAIAHDRLVATAQEIRQQASAANQQIHAMLRSASTTAKLVEMWPEAAAFLPLRATPTVALPAVPVADLNATLRLGEAA